MLTNLVFSACEYNHLMSQDYKVLSGLIFAHSSNNGSHSFWVQPSNEQKLHHDLIFTYSSNNASGLFSVYKHLMSKNYIITLFFTHSIDNVVCFNLSIWMEKLLWWLMLDDNYFVPLLFRFLANFRIWLTT